MSNKNKQNILDDNDHQIFYNPSNEISINDLIWEIDNSDDFKLFEIDDNDSNNEKNILIKIYKN